MNYLYGIHGYDAAAEASPLGRELYEYFALAPTLTAGGVGARSADMKYSLLLGSVRADFGFALCVLQRSQFGGNAAGNGCRLTRILEAGEIRAVAPCKRPAQPLSRTNRRVVYYVDQPFVVGCALLIAREIAQISAGCKDRGHTRNGGDFACRHRAVERLDHLDEHNVVIDGIAIPTRDIPPHRRIKSLSATQAAFSERWEHG